MKKLFSLIIFVFICATSIFAQVVRVKGKVVDDTTNLAIPSVSVLISGTKQGTSTDEEGNFSLTISGKKTINLIISHVGYKTKIVSTNGSTPLTIKLSKQINDVNDEVIVVGYTTLKKKDVAGSISSIDAKQLKDFPLSSAAEALQGRLAGVQVVSSGGAPGEDVTIKVRGGGSITQDNSPLFIVDGVQVENALSVIAPQDIARIDVLKDASTTAIYGARAANGVVVITTKGGKPGKTQVAYNGSMGWREIQNTLDVLNPYDYVLWQYERSRNNLMDSVSFATNYGRTWDTLSAYKDIAGINWQEQVFGRKGLFQNHNVSVNGGTAATNFNLSLTNNKEEGIMIMTGFTRSIINFKLDHKISDKFKAGITVRYLDQTIDGTGTASTGNRRNNRLRHAITYRPFEVLTPNGGINDFDEEYFQTSFAINPIILANNEYRKQKSNGIYFSGYLNYNIAKNLLFRSTFGYDNSSSKEDLFYGRITFLARQYGSQPLASIRQFSFNTINNSNTLQYTLNRYKNKHDINILLGHEIVDRGGSTSFIETRYFPADITADKALANMALGAAPFGSVQPLPATFIAPPSRIFSLFGRVSYGYKDRYLATFNLRSDRSSKFNSENGSLVFPSTSLAWKLSKEKFWKNNWFIKDAKLRFGFGVVGNNRIDDLLYQQLYSVNAQYAFNGIISPGFSPQGLANHNLRWEKNQTLNLGLDFSLFNHKVQLTVDYYKNTANDLLLTAQIPPTNGYISQLQNIGGLTNRGLEIQINASPVATKNFGWTSNFNISFNRNIVSNLGGPQQITRTSGWQTSDGIDDYLIKVGQPIGLMYGFVSDGFYKLEDFDYNETTRIYTLKPGVVNNSFVGYATNNQNGVQPGAMKWKDISGPNGVPDGIISADYDRVVIGKAQPDFIGGWNNQFTYKNFDLSVFVNFVVGNDVYNANKIELTNGGFPHLNTLNIMKNRWTNINAEGQRVTSPSELAELNKNAEIWTPDRNGFRYWLHSWAIEDGSYLRINNITIGYTLPKKIIDKVKITSLRFYATVNNLANLTKYSGYDPDISNRRSDPLTPGVDAAAYPRSTTWIFGANVNF